MKKSLLLVLGLAATMVLAACEPTEPTPSTSDSTGTEDTSVYVTGLEIVDNDTKAPIDVLNISLTNGGDVDVVLTPTNADVKDVTWSVSEEGILDLTEIDYGSVEALKAGTVTLTATAVGAEEGTTVSDSITVNAKTSTIATNTATPSSPIRLRGLPSSSMDQPPPRAPSPRMNPGPMTTRTPRTPRPLWPIMKTGSW